MYDPSALTIAVLFPVLFLLSAAVAGALRRIPVLDVPNDRSSHSRPIPRIGGVAIVVSYLIGLLALALSEPSSIGSAGVGLVFAVTCLFISIIGLVDDVGKLRRSAFKLILQCLGALVLVLFGVSFREISVPVLGNVDLGWLGPVITMFWLVAVTNAVNFMDGLDGLAAGTCAIAAMFFASAMYLAGATGLALVCALLVPPILGFLPFNFPRASLFMGDVGSQFLGFSLAALAVIAAQQPDVDVCVLVMPLLIFHFLFDTFLTLVRRTLGRQRISEAHRTHLYQLVNRLGWSHSRVSGLHFAFAVLQGIGALFICKVAPEFRAAVFLPFLALESVYAVVVIRLAVRHGILGNGG